MLCDGLNIYIYAQKFQTSTVSCFQSVYSITKRPSNELLGFSWQVKYQVEFDFVSSESSIGNSSTV